MGFLWPVHKATGLKKTEAELSESERARIVEDIERDQTSNMQRGLKIDAKAIDQGVRLLQKTKGREGYFDELLKVATDPNPKAKTA